MKKNEQGFTLIELMVVVAIIGILAVISFPTYRKYQAKARTGEAKGKLSSVHTAETAFYTEFGTYATCLDYMGYEQDLGNNYYAIGFTDVYDSTNQTSVPSACRGGHQFAADRAVDENIITTSALNAGVGGSATASSSSYRVIAVGRISDKMGGSSFNFETDTDVWEQNINNNSGDATRYVNHYRAGY